MRNMTYTPFRSMPANVMGSALYGLSGCGCGGSVARRPTSTALSGGCGCGGGARGLGDSPLTSYLCSQTTAAKSLTEDANEAAIVVGIGAGAAAGILGGALRSPMLGLLGGALLGYLVYTTQKMPEP